MQSQLVKLLRCFPSPQDAAAQVRRASAIALLPPGTAAPSAGAARLPLPWHTLAHTLSMRSPAACALPVVSLICVCMHLPAALQAVRMAKRHTGGTLRDDITVLVIDLVPTRPDARARDAAAPSFLDVAQATAAANAAPKPRPAPSLLRLFSRSEGLRGARKGSGASVAPLPLGGTLQLLADVDTWRTVGADAGGLQDGLPVCPTAGEARLMLPAASLQESQAPSPLTPRTQ